jgi:tRNA (cytidine/uridine-2'-O-)-methyltransferase
MRIALFEPDIPQNTGALIRLGACFGVSIDIIEPCGFLWNDRKLKRAGMDYLEHAEIVRHPSWAAFQAARADGRLLLLTTKAAATYIDFRFQADDILILGRESAGVPQEVHDAVQARLRIPIRDGIRSLNVAQAGAIVIAEALRQTGGFP